MGLEILPLLLLAFMLPFVVFVFVLNEAIIQREWIEMHKDNGWELPNE